MAARLSDEEVAGFIAEPKLLPDNYERQMTLRPKLGHEERDLTLRGQAGTEFRPILRRSRANPLDFSAILAYCVPNSNVLFRLRRYNGKSHEHCNRIEGDRFYAFHVHMATERYQDFGAREDAYAEPSDRFSTYEGARDLLFQECCVTRPPTDQLSLFAEVQ